jgi:hypothetical protein
MEAPVDHAFARSLLVSGALVSMLGCTILQTEHETTSHQPGDEGVAYFLPTNYVKLTVTNRPEEPPETESGEPPPKGGRGSPDATPPPAPPLRDRVELTVLPAVPDHARLYVANPKHHSQRDDTVEIQTTADGLLTSLTITTADRSGEIIAQLAKLAVKVAQFASGVPPTPAAADARGRPCEDYLNEFVFDPSSDGDLRRLTNELSRTCSPFTVTIQPAGRLAVAEAPTSGVEAIYYRRPRLYRFVAERANERYEEVFEALAGGPVFSLRYESGFLVERKYEAAFDGGQLERAKATEPSEILAAVTLPLTVLEEIGASLGSLLQINVKSETEKGDAPPTTVVPAPAGESEAGGTGPSPPPATPGPASSGSAHP